MPMQSRLANKGLHQTGRVGAAASRPVVEARPAGEARCYAYARAAILLGVMTATTFIGLRPAVAQPSFAQAIPREPRKPPTKNPRAIQTWLLANTKVQSLETLADLHSLLMDPEKDVRLAAAWALAHLRVAESGEEAVAYDEAPRLMHQTKPTFPYELRQRGIQGVVMVEFVIDERGLVAHAEVRESIPGLDDPAVACVKEWRFAPAKWGGKSIPAGAQAPVTFRITK